MASIKNSIWGSTTGATLATSFLLRPLETRWLKEQASRSHWSNATATNFGVSPLGSSHKFSSENVAGLKCYPHYGARPIQDILSMLSHSQTMLRLKRQPLISAD